jgi:hypothetical protein
MEFIVPAIALIIIECILATLLCVATVVFWLLFVRRRGGWTRKRALVAALIVSPILLLMVGLPILGAYSEAHWMFIDEPLQSAVADHDASRVKHLLSIGADPNADFEGYTALEEAAANGDVEIVRLLLEHGAKVEERNTWTNHTPLRSARENKHPEAVKLLQKAGASH